MARGEPLRAAIIRSSSPSKRKQSAKAPCRRARVSRAASTGEAPRSIALRVREDDGFGVGLGFRSVAVGGKLGAQVAEVLDDAVVDDRDASGLVGVGVLDRCRAMGGPAGVADSGLAGKRFMDQKVGKVDQLADRAAAVEAGRRSPWRCRRCHSRGIPAASAPRPTAGQPHGSPGPRQYRTFLMPLCLRSLNRFSTFRTSASRDPAW